MYLFCNWARFVSLIKLSQKQLIISFLCSLFEIIFRSTSLSLFGVNELHSNPYLLAFVDVGVWVTLAITNIGARILLSGRSFWKSSSLIEDVWRFDLIVFVWTLQSAWSCERLKEKSENILKSWHKEKQFISCTKCNNVQKRGRNKK